MGKDIKNVINITDMTVEELDDLMDLADDIIDNPAKYANACKGKKLATLFFEPSTRTRLSFEAAMSGGSFFTSSSVIVFIIFRLLIGLDPSG